MFCVPTTNTVEHVLYRNDILTSFIYVFMTANDFRSGADSLFQCTGLGKIKPNTVVLGFKTNWNAKEEDKEGQDNFEKSKTTKNFVSVIQDAFDQQLGVVIFRSNSADSPSNSQIFNEKREGSIDVWWLLDDGGRTLLIPYLLSLNRYWRKCKLRVFRPAKATSNASELNSSKIRMASLLKKFRIDVSDVIEFEGISQHPSERSIKEFEELRKDSEVDDHRKKSLRHIRLGELLKEHSKKASLIVMTLPIPSEAVEPSLYMSWLEVMTTGLPPIMLIRGNHTNVLTFYT